MTDYDKTLVEQVAENAYEVDVTRADKPELLMAVFEMLEVPYEPDRLSDSGNVRADELRAIIYAICLSEYIEYSNPDDQAHTEELVRIHAPASDSE